MRPDIGNPLDKDFGGYTYDTLVVAGLARHIQATLYIHTCTDNYCLKNRAACRFFFPWPEQPHQCYDEHPDRVAVRRCLPADDQWVVPHNLELMMFSPATVNVLPFDPKHGADQARIYVPKYGGKPEPFFWLEHKQKDPVKDHILARTVGLPLCINRLLNFHVVRNTRPVHFTPARFVPDEQHRTPRESDHKKFCPGYPDPEFYLTSTMKYFFRNKELQHLRIAQFNRYFCSLTAAVGAEDDPELQG